MLLIATIAIVRAARLSVSRIVALGSKREVAPLKLEVRSTLRSGYRQTVTACPFRADTVAKVEDRATPDIKEEERPIPLRMSHPATRRANSRRSRGPAATASAEIIEAQPQRGVAADHDAALSAPARVS